MAKIFVFRHAQTNYNKNGIFTGWAEADLTEGGKKEAEQIGEMLKGEIATKAYASDLKRSQETLSIVLNIQKSKVGISIDPRIKERSYGDLTGKNKNEVAAAYPREYPLWHRSYDVSPPNGESIKDVEVRVLSFLADLIPSLRKDDVVFLSVHGNSLRPIRRYFEKISVEEMCSFEHVAGKVYKYEV